MMKYERIHGRKVKIIKEEMKKKGEKMQKGDTIFEKTKKKRKIK
jgi:hypothetical protein